MREARVEEKATELELEICLVWERDFGFAP
jgi:hypothetical protein